MNIFRKKNLHHTPRASQAHDRIFKLPVDTGSRFNFLGGYSGPDSLSTAKMASKQAFYRYIRESIPLVSAAVWAWVKLCNTPSSIRFEGTDSESKKAEIEIRELEQTILENPFFRGDPFRQLNELMFTEIFTVGRFAGKLHLLKDGSGVDFLETLDAYQVHWGRKTGQKWTAKYGLVESEAKTIKPDEIFVSTLGQDISNPFGIEPLSSIPFVLGIEEQFLDDMAKSSHNAGFPRLQIRITPPESWDNEKPEQYASRINKYFDDTVSEFSDMAIDKNIFSWNDVEVSIIGGEKGRSFTWKIHREQIIEDVITGMKLFPWVLGRSHGTTKEWVRSQYNLLMQEVDSIQSSARSLVEWIVNEHLKLKKINAAAMLVFEPNKDPFEIERENAFGKRIENLDKLLQSKVITEDEHKDTLRNKWLQT